jgi:hypothetical protein
MTQHLLRASKSYTLFVSDRLVSGGTKNDPTANKNLIYLARDAIVAIGYAGRAYHPSNSNVPSDEWMAELLWGKPILRGADGVAPSTLVFDNAGHVLKVGQAIKLLQRELQNAFAQLNPKQRRAAQFHLVVSGLRQSRFGTNLVLTQLIKKRDAIVIESVPRYINRLRNRTCVLSFPDGYMSTAQMDQIGTRLKCLTPDESESVFVDQIRLVSSEHPDRVGPHCLSILLPHPKYGDPIRVRFIPTVEHSATLTSRSLSFGTRTAPVAFSPWIVGPDLLCAPSLMIGTHAVQIGQTRITLEGPEQRGFSAIFSQRRPLA